MKEGTFKNIFVFFIIIYFIGFVASIDIGYVYEKEFKIDFNLINQLNDQGENVFLISSYDLNNVDFSKYDLLLIGDERFSNPLEIPVDLMPSIIMNHYHGEEFGILNEGRISQISSNKPLRVMVENEKEVYIQSSYDLGKVGLKYYYLPEKYKSSNMESIAKTSFKYNSDDVISYSSEGEKCFFGIVESEYWTSDAKDLFNECFEYVTRNLDNYEIPEEPEKNDTEVPSQNETQGIHDIEISNLKIKNSEGDLIEGENIELINGEKYKILIDLENLGDFNEDVNFEGGIESGEVLYEFSHISVSNLEPGENKKEKVRTIQFDLPSGNYNLFVRGIIENDDFEENNKISIPVKIV
jgi:hypothetical protein